MNLCPRKGWFPKFWFNWSRMKLGYQQFFFFPHSLRQFSWTKDWILTGDRNPSVCRTVGAHFNSLSLRAWISYVIYLGDLASGKKSKEIKRLQYPKSCGLATFCFPGVALRWVWGKENGGHHREAWLLVLALLSPQSDCGKSCPPLGLRFLPGKVGSDLGFVGKWRYNHIPHS